MPGPVFIRGETVSLHPIEEDDHEFVQYGRNHPEVRQPLLTTGIETTDDVAELLEDADYRLLVCVGDEDDPEPVGLVAVPWHREDDRVGYLSYWIVPEHQGNGYVTEATELFLDYLFRERGFHKLDAGVLASNERSQAILERIGFQREGVQREEHVHDGGYEDQVQFGLLAREWLDG